MILNKTARIHSYPILTLIVIIVLLSSISYAAQTFTVQETQEISLAVNATDPDNDDVTFGFTNPFNENGIWRTTYDDAGEYLVDISATDGEYTDTTTVTVVVVNKNRAPIVGKTHLTFSEGELIDLTEFIADPDDDILEYQFDTPFNNVGQWQTTLNDGGRYVIDFIVNDGKSTISDRVEIIIEETNQAPTILDVFSDSSRVSVFEDDTLEFDIDAIDNDGDDIAYVWQLDSEEIATSKSGEYYFDFDSEGQHTLSVTLSDNELSSSMEWVIDIAKTNRAPAVMDLDATVYETETLSLGLVKTDIDGDILTYNFESPIENDGTWKTGYEDSGTHTIQGSATDGEFTTSFEVTISVKDLDRAPHIDVPEFIEISEGQRLEWFLDITDPDEDTLSIDITNLPQDASFDKEDKNVEWDVSYDYITRKNNVIFNTLNALRLEHYLLAKRDRVVEITACGSELCSKHSTTLRIFNTNRAPEFVEMYDQQISETDELSLYVSAVDPDGDVIKYVYSDPVGKRSGKWRTNYDDSGEYVVAVTASDGFLQDNDQLTIDVANTNRDPTIKVKQDKVVVNEGQEFTIQFSSSDPDSEDSVIVMMDSVPTQSSLDPTSFVWRPSFDTVLNSSNTFWSKILSHSNYLTKKLSKNKQDVWLEFVATDGDSQVVHPLQVIVKDINRVPVIKDVEPAYEKFETVTDVPVRFSIDAYDLDLDELSYTWSFSGVDLNDVTETNVITREFKTAGEKKVKVVISDGKNSAKYEWAIIVKAGEKEVQETIRVLQQPEFSFRIYKIENWK
jgi:hypothetical protein